MGIDRYVYAANDTTWVATFMERIEKQSKGYNAVSLSNYDATGVCVITDGSAFEIAGSMYLCTTDTSITASCATGVCYIMATGATATASVAWSTAAPVWRDDLQGYYASAASVVRALGGIHFDGASYNLKWIYHNIDTGPITKYTKMLNTATAGVGLGLTLTNGAIIFDATADTSICDISLKDNSVVTEMGAETDAAGSDAITISLNRVTMTDNVVTTMASVAATSGDPDPNDTSISYDLINNQLYRYIIYGDCTAVTGDISLNAVWIKYIHVSRWDT